MFSDSVKIYEILIILEKMAPLIEKDVFIELLEKMTQSIILLKNFSLDINQLRNVVELFFGYQVSSCCLFDKLKGILRD
jgi:hypothetical protein